MARQKKIRATIITGYLGAGKTTLINNLLRKYNKSTFALVENEFGEVAVDSHLIRGIDASRLFELKNGCICCTITQEYELVLNELAEKYPHIGELLIETTGIADPGEIIKPFIHDPEIRSTYEFCGIICVADVVRTSENLSKNAVWQQIAMAGAVVISKTEQMSPEEIQAFTRELSKVNPFAPCFLSQRNGTTVVLSDFWNNRARTLQLAIQDKPIHEEISSRTVRIEQPPDRKKFEKWLDYTLDVRSEERRVG